MSNPTLAQPALNGLALSRRAMRMGVAAAVLTVGFSGTAFSQSAGAVDHFAREWLEQSMASTMKSAGSLPLRPEVIVGSLDPRLQLAPCARVEPYLPTGAQLWGRSRIGLKCVEGPVAWNVFLPVTVKAWGPGWVVRRTIQANAPVTAADVELVAEVDWADQKVPVLTQIDQWQGMIAAYTLMPGHVMRENNVRAAQAFGAGSQVRVVATGPGFQLNASGEAMTNGYVGQVARIKLENGKIVSGKVRTGGSVEVAI